MNITTANVSTKQPLNSFFASPELLEEVEDGLNLLQRHRELLLQQAESLLDTPAPGSGCLSELSIIECIHDSADYQSALKALGDLFKASSEFIFALEQQNSHVELKIDHYEDDATSESMIAVLSVDTMKMSDEELENFGYFGWLAQ